MSKKPPFNAVADHCLRRIQSLLSAEQWGACQSVIVAYSGGLDSTVLLHAMAHLRDSQILGNRTLKAVHINHGLSDLAGEWLTHCEHQASALAVEFHSARLLIDDEFIKEAGGLEAAARQARYRVFEEQVNEGDVLLQAHHQDDQAETVLLRLMRGTGPKGLAGMPACRPLAKGQLVRPMLDLEKNALQSCVQAGALRWVEDPSNRDIEIERNYLRKDIMPLLEARWPGFAKRWAGAADLCRQSDNQLEDYLAGELDRCGWRSERLGSSLCLSTLREFSETTQHSLIRSALSRLNLAMPSRAQLSELDNQILAQEGRPESEARVHTGVCSFAAYKGRLYCWPQNALPETLPETWHSDQTLQLGNDWELRAREVDQSMPGLWLSAELDLRGRGAFKRTHPDSRTHSQSTKKLLQERGLEPWLRGHIPFIAYRGQLLAVGDLWVEKAAVEYCRELPGARYCQLIWRHTASEE